MWSKICGKQKKVKAQSGFPKVILPFGGSILARCGGKNLQVHVLPTLLWCQDKRESMRNRGGVYLIYTNMIKGFSQLNRNEPINVMVLLWCQQHVGLNQGK